MTMIAADSLFASLFPLLFIIFIGYIFKRTILPSQTIWDAIDALNFRLLIPALIVGNMVGADIRALPTGPIFLLVFGALLAIAGATLLLGRIVPSLRGDAPGFTSVFQTSTRWNAPIAIVVCDLLFLQNAVGIVAIMMIAIMPVVNGLNIWVMVRWLNAARTSARSVVLAIASNPIIIGCFIGVVAAATAIPIPPAIHHSAVLLGDASIATILLSVGAGLGRAGVTGRLTPVALSCFIRLILAPLLVLAGGMMFMIDPAILAIAIIAMGMPTAANGYVVARQMGGDAPLYAAICALQTSAAFITIPLWIMVCAMILPNW